VLIATVLVTLATSSMRRPREQPEAKLEIATSVALA